MKVKLRQRYAGPNGNYAADTEIEVLPEEGRALCEGGFATPVKCVAADEIATVEPPETAADEAPAPRPRGRPPKNLKR